jgi:serine/threonine protein kinase
MNLLNANIDKRFHIKELIYEDLFAARYQGTDNSSGETVSIKTWKFPIADRLIKIKGNLEKINNFTFDNTLNLIQYGDHKGYLYTVHHFIEGISLNEMINQGSRLTIDDMIHLLESLITGLESLHTRGVTHGGIKPSNIIIPFHEGHYFMDNAHLSDPLQSRILYINDPIEEKTIRESVYALAPESIIASGITITPESDQYSLGVLFYYLISGSYPHEDADISKILYSHTTSSYNPLQDVPDYVNEILMKLMSKNPADRYPSITDLNKDFTVKTKRHQDILSGFYTNEPEIDMTPSFIGRIKEMKIMKSTLHDLLNGEGTACFLTGPGGSGKTRFIKEFLKHADALNIKHIYYSSSFQKNKKKPYALISAILEEYLIIFRSYDREKQREIKETLLNGIEKIAPLLLKIDPVFEELIGKPDITVRPLEGDRDRQRFEMLINRFIHNIAEAENGIVLVVEDIEKADRGSLELTGNLLPHVNENKILFISSANIDEGINIKSIYPTIDDIDAAREQFLLSIHLSAMSQEEHRAFTARIFHTSINLIKTISDYIYQKSTGIPFMSLEVIKELKEQEIIFYSDGNWHLDNNKSSLFQAPESIFSQLLKSTDRLTADDKTLLGIASVFSYKIDTNTLKKYAVTFSQLGDKYESSIESLLSKQYLEKDVTDPDAYIFCDTRIKDIFYKSLHTELKSKIHLERALEIEKNDDKENLLFEIAHHYMNSNDVKKAVAYSLKAGKKAREAYLYEDALNYFSYCTEDETVEPDLRIEAALNSSIIDINLGHYQTAISRLEKIIEITPGDRLPHIYMTIGMAYHKLSDFKNSEANALKGLELLNEFIPQKGIFLFVKTVKEFIAYYIVRFFHMGRFQKNEKAQKQAKLSIEIMKNLTWDYMVYNIPRFIYIVMRLRTIAGRYLQGMEEEALSYEVFAGMLMAARRFNQAEKYLQKSIKINSRLKNENNTYQNYKILGFVSLWKCQFEKAIKLFQKATEGFKSIGDISEEMSVYPPLFDAYGLQGRYSEAETVINTLHDYSLSNNDTFLLAIAVYNRMLLASEKGHFDQGNKWSLKTLDLMDEKNPQRVCISYTGTGYYHLMAGEYEKALHYLEKAMEVYNKNRFLGQYTVNLFCFRAEAALKLAQQNNSINRDTLYKYCKDALKKAKPWPTHYGKALRTMGIFHTHCGKYTRAKKYLHKSIQLHEKNNMRFELARSIYENALSKEKFGYLDESKSLYERAYIIFDDINSQYLATQISLLLGLHSSSSTVVDNVMARKRLHLFMDLIHDIRKKDNEDDLFNSILSVCIDITTSDFGIIFLVNDENDKLSRSYVSGRGISDEIILQSQASRIFNSRKIDFLEIMDFSEIREHLIFKDIESIKMFIPVLTRDEILGICCLEKKSEKNDYTDDEFSMINMLLFQSGILLDNIRLEKIISQGPF